MYVCVHALLPLPTIVIIITAVFEHRDRFRGQEGGEGLLDQLIESVIVTQPERGGGGEEEGEREV